MSPDLTETVLLIVLVDNIRYPLAHSEFNGAVEEHSWGLKIGEWVRESRDERPNAESSSLHKRLKIGI